MTTATPYRMTRGKQGHYRGLVAAAWQSHCESTGIKIADKAAQRVWYERILVDTCGIMSTTEATRDQVGELCRRFEGMAAEIDASIYGFTKAQNKAINQLATQAVKRRRSNATVAAWLDGIYESAGVYERHAFNKVDDFDNVVAALAILANNTYWIERTSEACERRLRWLISDRCRKLSDATDNEYNWNYVRAIYDNMALPLTIEEAPAEWLRKVFAALDMQWRRVKSGRSRATRKPVAVVSQTQDELPF